MTQLVWDAPATRFFETGLDRGVLYLDTGTGVPWNGLVSVEEQFEETNTPVYLDGVKVSDKYPPGNFRAKLSAFTYPDEFLPYQGVETFHDSGMMITGQSQSTFGLSYRTLVGNDILGEGFGYQIHLLYNLIAIPEDVTYVTYSNNTDLAHFGWNIQGVPVHLDGFRPVTHVIIDSRFITLELLTYLEQILYGSEAALIKSAEVDPYHDVTYKIKAAVISDYISDLDLPTPATILGAGIQSETATLLPLEELVDLVLNFDAKLITPHEDTGLADLTPGYGDVTSVLVDGLLTTLPNSRLIPTMDDQYYTFNDE